VHLTSRGGFAVLRESFQLSFHELAKRAIFKSLNDRSGALRRHEEHTFAGNKTANVIDLTKKRSLFYGWAQQSQRTYRGSAHIMGWYKNSVPDTKPQLNHQFPPRNPHHEDTADIFIKRVSDRRGPSVSHELGVLS
jgi:hypothetical protein